MSRYILGCLTTALFLVAIWHWSPLQKIDVDQLQRWTEPVAKHPAAPLIIVASYVAASLVLFPRPMLTLAFVGIFGPWRTAVYGMTGLLLAAASGFLVWRHPWTAAQPRSTTPRFSYHRGQT